MDREAWRAAVYRVARVIETTPSGGDLSPAGLRHPRQSAATRVQMYRYAHGPDPQGEGGVLLSTHTRAHAHVHEQFDAGTHSDLLYSFTNQFPCQ